jgi:hypothetical protein
MEIKLTRPAAGQQHVVDALHSLKGESLSLVVDALPENAILERAGDDVIIMFGDEASIVLPDFFLTFTREDVPDLIAGGSRVTGADFWDLLLEERDLDPQAGHGRQIPNGGRHYDYEDLELLDGYDVMDGIDTDFGFLAGLWGIPDESGALALIGSQTGGADALRDFLADPDNRALAYDDATGRNGEPDAEEIAVPGQNDDPLPEGEGANILVYAANAPFPDGGPGLDVLLVDNDDAGFLSALFDADPGAVRALADIEVILLGDVDALSLTKADGLLEQLGLDSGGDETIAVDPARWQPVEDSSLVDAGYEAYADDEMYVLVQKTALEQGAA